MILKYSDFQFFKQRSLTNNMSSNTIFPIQEEDVANDTQNTFVHTKMSESMDYLKIPKLLKRNGRKKKLTNLSNKFTNFSTKLTTLSNPYQSVQEYSFKTDKSIFNSRNIIPQNKISGVNNFSSLPEKKFNDK